MIDGLTVRLAIALSSALLAFDNDHVRGRFWLLFLPFRFVRLSQYKFVGLGWLDFLPAYP